MPYAQHHYPFENEKRFEGSCFPAQFIAEGLDQTRGWFYSLIVLGTALFGKSPYENVIVNGLVLAEDGRKMSKKLGNYPDLGNLLNRVGADTLRYSLLSSPAVHGEDVSFSEKDAIDLQRKNIGRLHNVLAMYEQYADPKIGAKDTSSHVLDRWMIARIAETVRDTTQGYTSYELDKATRPLTDIIDDLSVWYLRRSRDRLKGTDEADKVACLTTLRYTLKSLSLLMAPVMPFYAEYLFLRVREDGDAESVHLMDWPEVGEVDTELLATMQVTREIVTTGLEARSKGNIKVRQPLQKIKIKNEQLNAEFALLVSEELNVKEVSFDPQLEAPCELDTTITPELKREGDVREFIRAIQETRKTMGLNPHDRISLIVDDVTHELITSFESEIVHVVGAEGIVTESEKATQKLVIDATTYAFGVEPIS
jgi:isoleucyl-tRNA synthetase